MLMTIVFFRPTIIKGLKSKTPRVCGGVFFQWIEMLDSLYIVRVCAYSTNFRNHFLGREFFAGFL